jgi:hypothetical protein
MSWICQIWQHWIHGRVRLIWTWAIHPVYEEACRYIEAHSQPIERLNIVRTVDELEKDFKTMVAAVDAYKKAS